MWSNLRRRDPVLLSPAVLTAVIGVLAVLTPQDVPFTRLLPAAPALAASVWSVRATLTLGMICLLPVIGYALAFSDMSALYTAGAIGAVTLAAAYASHLRLQREHTLAQVRAVADATQEVLLRPVPRRVGNLEIAIFYLAAAPQARIGGDFYAAADTPHGLRLILGDVRGKGLPAVGVSAALLGSFHEAAYDAPDLAHLAERLETTIARYTAAVPAEDDCERFATAVIVEIPPGADHARVLSCGHLRPCWCTTAAPGPSSPPSPHRRSTWRHFWAPATTWTASPSPSATCCCSTPTASARPATRTAPSSRSPTGPGRPPPRHRPGSWNCSTRPSSGTATAASTTTSPASPSGRPPRRPP
ncbi:Stage II sporulation protein E (SpoIIE) [Actinacidiphila glaucinigra]|uniref:Stage II sporulation protein E (SpoIIE) n=1 Tax=Actinacidiphila glaucinigra TaxID=235986 RepID=A0A239N0L4_9ACTN|nr:Stage II sporulation protein E (SpoIIE) [Actinacidiphila glaucinigra]